MQRKHNFDSTSQTQNPQSFDIKRWLPDREKLGKTTLSRVLLPLMLLSAAYGVVGAQEAVETQAPAETWTIYIITSDIRLREAPTRGSETIRTLQAGEQVNVSATESGHEGYVWATVVDENGMVIGYFALSGNGVNSAQVLEPEAAAAPVAPTEAPVEISTSRPELGSDLATISPTEVAPTITPEQLRAQQDEVIDLLVSQGFVNVNNVLVPSGFSFGVETLPVDIASRGDSDIRDGILGTGRPWIEGSLQALGFSPEWIQHYIDGGGAQLYMMGDAAIDRHLRENRLGSWGTTMFITMDGAAVPTLVPAFHSTEFAQAQYGNLILRDTAVEEAVQGPLYQNIFQLQAQHPDYFAYWGFPDQASLVESLSQNGHLRAFLEYGQHAGIQSVNTGWSGDSYTHQIGTGVEGGTFALREDFVNLVNTVMGTQYTTIQEVLPYFADQRLLMQLNFEFRQWSFNQLGTEYNVWDAFGLYRGSRVSIQPLVNFDF